MMRDEECGVWCRTEVHELELRCMRVNFGFRPVEVVLENGFEIFF
jgi:hypothetical protein